MKAGIVIQARLGSTRLPGKILLRAGHWSLLELCASRAARARHAAVTIIATTEHAADDPVEAEASRLGFPVVRGDEADVLSRYHLAAETHQLDVVCRVTSDCPFIDPAIIDRIFARFFSENLDYASNTLRRTYPRGMGAEVIRATALARAQREATLPPEREHVTPYIRNHPERFKLGGIEHCEDLSAHRWTVDEADDLRFVREVLDHLPHRRTDFSLADVLRVLATHPHLSAINAHVEQKSP